METKSSTRKEKVRAVNTLGTDFRAEVIAAGLIATGNAADKTMIIRQRGDKRHVSKDIDRIENDYSVYDMMEYLYIYTNRFGIYDSLPEGIFHQPNHVKKQKTKDDIIHEIRGYRDQEFFARRYFQPFEMVFDKLLVGAQEYEQKFDKAYFHSNLSEIFEDQWDILKHLTLAQALLFIRIIPVIAEVSESKNLSEKVMSIVLGFEVTINEGQKSWMKLEPQDRVKLGQWKLGNNSILGNSVESDDQDLIVTVGPLSPLEMKLFESGKSNDLILKKLIDIVLPFDRNKQIKYRISKEESKFRLSGKTHKAYLGINTTL